MVLLQFSCVFICPNFLFNLFFCPNVQLFEEVGTVTAGFCNFYTNQNVELYIFSPQESASLALFLLSYTTLSLLLPFCHF